MPKNTDKGYKIDRQFAEAAKSLNPCIRKAVIVIGDESRSYVREVNSDGSLGGMIQLKEINSAERK